MVTTSSGTTRPPANATRFVDFRAYQLKRGARTEFHREMSETVVPMLRRWNEDVVAYGPSPNDNESYYLIRSYRSLTDRQRNQDAFYGSPEWRQGPREAIVGMIEASTSVVLELDDRTLRGLRR
jgi:hypothetical protein